MLFSNEDGGTQNHAEDDTRFLDGMFFADINRLEPFRGIACTKGMLDREA
jgi:hypothetical protein